MRLQGTVWIVFVCVRSELIWSGLSKWIEMYLSYVVMSLAFFAFVCSDPINLMLCLKMSPDSLIKAPVKVCFSVNVTSTLKWQALQCTQSLMCILSLILNKQKQSWYSVNKEFEWVDSCLLFLSSSHIYYLSQVCLQGKRRIHYRDEN